MLSKFLGLVLLSILLGVVCTNETYGQLLEDRNKLKTEKATKKGFSLYKKKVIKRSPSGERQTDDKSVSPKFSIGNNASQNTKEVTPKYSRRTKGKKIRAVTPRYSQENAGKSSDKVVTPKYSKRKKSGKITIINPKYSQDIAGQGSDRLVIPKYSRQRAGQNSDRIVSPKYSQDIAGQGSDRYVQPKYSQNMAGQGSDRIVRPKYSKERAGQGSDRIVQPKYTRYLAGQGSDRIVRPKYSKERAGQGSDRVVQPRYTRYLAGQGSDRVVQPRFSVNPIYEYKYRLPPSASGSMVFKFPVVQHYIKRKKNHGEEDWNGPWVKIPDHKRPEFADYTGKFKKQKKGRNMHPSANYMYAKYNNSRIARDVMQKASVLWVRVHMNQTDPKGVKKKAPKLKFDKDETEIWNNEEREYTKN
ncbi:hypothetical protein [Reichenbachiella sp. MALMAid0571]|uniref:hypothetical protein n=1 Tax=Reichenbachiella sp. MALMAid0571 TaxID=3143939 RepID=UPI0032DEA033